MLPVQLAVFTTHTNKISADDSHISTIMQKQHHSELEALISLEFTVYNTQNW